MLMLCWAPVEVTLPCVAPSSQVSIALHQCLHDTLHLFRADLHHTTQSNARHHLSSSHEIFNIHLVPFASLPNLLTVMNAQN